MPSINFSPFIFGSNDVWNKVFFFINPLINITDLNPFFSSTRTILPDINDTLGFPSVYM